MAAEPGAEADILSCLNAALLVRLTWVISGTQIKAHLLNPKTNAGAIRENHSSLEHVSRPSSECAAAAPRSFPLLAPNDLLAARFGQAAGPMHPVGHSSALPALEAPPAGPLSRHSNPVSGPPPDMENQDALGAMPSDTLTAAECTAQGSADRSTAGRLDVLGGGQPPRSAHEGSMGRDIHPYAGNDTVATGNGSPDKAHAPTVTMNPVGASWQVPQQLPAGAPSEEGREIAGESACGQQKGHSAPEALIGELTPKAWQQPHIFTMEDLNFVSHALH